MRDPGSQVPQRLGRLSHRLLRHPCHARGEITPDRSQSLLDQHHCTPGISIGCSTAACFDSELWGLAPQRSLLDHVKHQLNLLFLCLNTHRCGVERHPAALLMWQQFQVPRSQPCSIPCLKRLPLCS
jgi:hypothetical protein